MEDMLDQIQRHVNFIDGHIASLLISGEGKLSFSVIYSIGSI